jgi:hypothetical protein
VESSVTLWLLGCWLGSANSRIVFSSPLFYLFFYFDILLGNNVWAWADGILVSPRDVVLGSAFLPAHLCLGLPSWRTPSQSKDKLHQII